MKNPSIPSPTPAVMPTAPKLNAAGTAEALQKQKANAGFLSTFLGRGQGGASGRLSAYLGMQTGVPQIQTPRIAGPSNKGNYGVPTKTGSMTTAKLS